MRIAYHEALEGTRLDVVRLGALVGDAIRLAVEALNGRDAATGARVVAGDDTIDELRRSSVSAGACWPSSAAASNRTASS